jgi:hypothetical protein
MGTQLETWDLAGECLNADCLSETGQVSGSSQEGGLRVWRASESAARFDLAQQPLKLHGHTGPITSLALDDE